MLLIDLIFLLPELILCAMFSHKFSLFFSRSYLCCIYVCCIYLYFSFSTLWWIKLIRMLKTSEVRCEEILPSNWHHWVCHVDRKLGNWRPKAERMLSNIGRVNEPVWLQETHSHLTIRQVAARPNTCARYTLYPCSRSVNTTREHGCHFGHPWTRAIEIGRRYC